MSRPALHALLNGTAALFLILGWQAIRGRWPLADRPRRRTHVACMVAALAVSTVFLASYVDWHLEVGHVPFWGTGALKAFYLLVLIPHVVLAAAMVPPIVLLVVAALRGRFVPHRRLARITLPVWIYVSVTGVLVYLLNHAARPA